ncbi:MAG: MerR family transcriptional regulator [Planctomycetota bacterium]
MTEQNDDFVSFEKALRDLKLQSEELKKLVSEGEIRAFRDGQSMKFRKEDVDALATQQTGEDELVLADALEDDTGMVTEELSEEDTLLVEDDLDEIEEEAAPARVPQARTRREQLVTKREGEHPLVMAAIILTGIGLLWGALLSWDITQEAKPGDSIASKFWEESQNGGNNNK